MYNVLDYLREVIMAQLSRTKKYQEFRDKLDEETTAAQSEPVKPRLSRVENHRLSHANKPLHSHEAGRASTNTKTDYQTSPVMDELLGEVKQYNIDNGTRITDDTQINILRQLDTPLEAKKRTQHFLPMEDDDEEESGTTMELPRSLSEDSALASLMPSGQKLTRINPVAVKETEISAEEVDRMIEEAKKEEVREVEKIVLSSSDIRADEKADTDQLNVLMTNQIEEETVELPKPKKKKKKKKAQPRKEEKPRKAARIEKEEIDMPSAKMRMRAEDFDNDISEKKSKKSGMVLNIILVILIVVLIASIVMTVHLLGGLAG